MRGGQLDLGLREDIGREGEGLKNVLYSQAWIGIEKFGNRHPGAEFPKDEVNRDPRSLDAGFAGDNLWIDGNSLVPHECSIPRW